MGGEIVVQALKTILAALRKLGHLPVLVGGLGIQAWGRIRQTKDVDLLVLSPPQERERLLAAAEAEGLIRDPVRPIVTIEGTTILRLAYCDPKFGITVRVDLIEASGGFLEDVVRRSRPGRLFDQDLRLPTCEDLILMKLLAGRPIDLADSAELLRLNSSSLDHDDLGKRAADLGLSKLLQTALTESSRDPS